jgi:hypothetical protein
VSGLRTRPAVVYGRPIFEFEIILLGENGALGGRSYEVRTVFVPDIHVGSGPRSNSELFTTSDGFFWVT